MRKNIDWKRFVYTAYAETEQPIPVILEEDVGKILTKAECRKFTRFMGGQTCALLPGGQTGYYPTDFRRFLAGLPVID